MARGSAAMPPAAGTMASVALADGRLLLSGFGRIRSIVWRLILTYAALSKHSVKLACGCLVMSPFSGQVLRFFRSSDSSVAQVLFKVGLSGRVEAVGADGDICAAFLGLVELPSRWIVQNQFRKLELCMQVPVPDD